jgi:hypothetical protein
MEVRIGWIDSNLSGNCFEFSRVCADILSEDVFIFKITLSE